MWIGVITIFFYFHSENFVYIFVVVELMCESKDREHLNLILMDLIVDLPVTNCQCCAIKTSKPCTILQIAK